MAKEFSVNILMQLKDQLTKQSKKISKRLNALGKQMQDFGKKMTVGVTLPILAIGTAMTKTAIDAEETESKFATVFKSVSEEAEATAKNLAKNFGLSSLAAKQLLSDTGDLLSGFGFSGEAALDMSKKVNELAVDLASFTNYSGGAKGASAALTKALLGERESIKSLGIAISETDIQDLAKEKGITGELSRQTKAMLTLELAMRQSKNAIGDFSRTQDSAANQIRVLQSRLQDLAVSLGKRIIPVVMKVIDFINGLIEKFDGLDSGTKDLILMLAGFAAAIGPVTTALGGLLKGLSLIAAHPVGAIITALAAGFIALGFAIKGAIDEAERFEKTIRKGMSAAEVATNIRKGEKVGLDIAKKAYNDLETAINNNYKKITDYEKALKNEGKTIHNMTIAQKEEYDALVAKQDKLIEGQEVVGKYIKTEEKRLKQEKKKKKGIDETNKSLEDQYKLLTDIDQALKDSIVREIIAETGERFVSRSQIMERLAQRQGFNIASGSQKEKTQVEVAIKLKADKGTEATIENVKKPKGDSEVKFINDTYLGVRPI